MLRKRARVAPWRARSSRRSPSGTLVRPSARVRITVCDSSGKVSSLPSAAAAAVKEETPGTISYSIPSASKRRICSATEPKIDGSPVCTRATSSPASRAARQISTISSRVMPLESSTREPGRARATTWLGTSEPV